MVKVAVISGVGDIADMLNEYDTTGGKIKYYSICFRQLKTGFLFNLIYRLIKFFFLIRRYDVLFIAYICRFDYLYAFIAKTFKIPTIAQWVGCDVRLLLHSGKKYRGLDLFATHLAVSPMLQEELAVKGIAAKEMRISPWNITFDIAPMPAEHAVYVYMPENQEEFYGYSKITQIINKYPHTIFYISANNDIIKFPQPNVKLTGWLSKEETEELYKKVSIILRCPEHDGWSRIIMEGLFKGKEIIYSFNEGPYMRKAVTVEEICREMDDILKNPPMQQIDAHEYAMENLMPQAYASKLAEEVETVQRSKT